jgi:replicative DNA helicase
MTRVIQRQGAIGGTTWGLREVDYKTDGVPRGELTILAGRPGMGKTGIGLGSALKMALKGHSVLYVSLEMMGVALANRCLSDLLFDTDNQVSYWDVTRGALTDKQAEAVVETARRFRNLPLEIEQQAGLSVSQISARARRHKAVLERRGKTLDVIIVDHLGLVQPSNMPAVELTRSRKRPAR